MSDVKDVAATVAADLRAEVEEVGAHKDTIISFTFQPAPTSDDRDPQPVTLIAISGGEQWGITDAKGGGNYVGRLVTHAALIKVLASDSVTSATVLVPGEAFKP